MNDDTHMRVAYADLAEAKVEIRHLREKIDELRAKCASQHRSLAAARRMAGEQWKRAVTAETLEQKLRDQAVVNGYHWTFFVEKIRKPLAGVRKYDSLGDPYYPDDLEIQLLRDRYDALLRWQQEALPVLRYLVTLAEHAVTEIPESIRLLLRRAEEKKR